MDLILLLPKLFSTAQAILAVLKGERSQENLTAIVDELFELVKAIPALAGVMGILQVVFRIVRVIIPEISKTPLLMKLMEDNDISVEEISAAEGIIQIFDELEKKMLEEADEIEKKIASMSDADILKQV